MNTPNLCILAVPNMAKGMRSSHARPLHYASSSASTRDTGAHNVGDIVQGQVASSSRRLKSSNCSRDLRNLRTLLPVCQVPTRDSRSSNPRSNEEIGRRTHSRQEDQHQSVQKVPRRTRAVHSAHEQRDDSRRRDCTRSSARAGYSERQIRVELFVALGAQSGEANMGCFQCFQGISLGFFILQVEFCVR